MAKTDSGFYTGYYSVFEKHRRIQFNYFAQNNYLLGSVSDKEELQHLVRFSQGYYTVEKWNDSLVFNDLRFGQMTGWYDPAAKFVFHYYLQKGGRENKLVVQRGRFANWNWSTTKSLLKRIAGK